MTHYRNLMAGMPKAGKTTFIAALFHVVESGQVEDSLQLVDLGETRDYLVQIRDTWLNCEEFDRTKLGEERVLTLRLRDPQSGLQTELILPDVSGETLRDQWEQRKSTKFFDDLARQAQGLMFFIHPDTVKDAVRINKSKELASVLDEEDAQPSTKQELSPEAQYEAQVDWTPKFSPMPVKLVELLQFLLREPDIYPLSRIALIISAWDSVKEDYDTPSAWLWQRVPLLAQFLKAHSDRIPYKVFGVSAQGGRLKEDRTRLLGVKKQSDRVEVFTDQDGEYNIHDISAPVKWLMNTKN